MVKKIYFLLYIIYKYNNVAWGAIFSVHKSLIFKKIYYYII